MTTIILLILLQYPYNITTSLPKAYEKADQRVVPGSRNRGCHGHPESPEGHQAALNVHLRQWLLLGVLTGC